MELNESSYEAVITIAIDFWKTKGRTDEQIIFVLNCEDDKLKQKFLKPGISIYKKILEKFTGEQDGQE